jgi:voltage-gated potassium channel
MEATGHIAIAARPSLRSRVYQAIGSAQSVGRVSHIFNMSIITLILLNVTAMILESVQAIHTRVPHWFLWFEYFSVGVFSVEYLLRLWSCVEDLPYRRPVRGRLRFMISPLALVDLSAVLPFYLPFLAIDLRVLRMFRMLRIMRLMRIAKLGRYSQSLQMLLRVVRSRKEELMSSACILLILVVVAASLIFYAEHETQPQPFSSIPAAMWWAVVTLTTIGYGDVYPVTVVGKLLASAIAVLGIGMVALPTAILGTGFLEEMQRHKKIMQCPHCGKDFTP